VQHDTELVLALFKTHKGLAPSQKVSSLYVFDALVRAAHGYVVKHSVVADSAPGKGNAATFLSKIEGIVEGLFEDMISSGAPGAEVSSSIRHP
jgi:protein NRD1